MKKGKKVLAASMAVTMAMTCLTACGGSASDKDTGKSKKPVAGVEVDDSKISEGLDKLGVEKPEAVPNNADAKAISLSVWCPAEEKEVMKNLCEAFDESRPEYDITFNYDFISEADASTMLINDPKKSADVFMFAGDQLANLVENKCIYDISALKDEFKDLEASFDDNAYKSSVIDGKLYALPFTPNQYFLYYNKSMLTEDDVKTLEAIMAKDMGEGNKNFAIDIVNSFYIVSFMQANDVLLFGKDGTEADKCDWNNSNAVDVVKYLNNLVSMDTKFHNDKDTDSISMLKNGTLASYVSGSWNSHAIKEALGDNYCAAVLPTINVGGSDKPLKPFSDYKHIGVNAVTQEPQASAQLVQFLTDEYAQLVRLEGRAYAPTLKRLQEAVLADENVDSTVVAAVKQMSAENSIPRPTTPQLSSYWNYGSSLGTLIYNKDEKVTDESQIQATLDVIAGGITASLK